VSKKESAKKQESKFELQLQKWKFVILGPVINKEIGQIQQVKMLAILSLIVAGLSSIAITGLVLLLAFFSNPQFAKALIDLLLALTGLMK
jgi:hypothetical protein